MNEVYTVEPSCNILCLQVTALLPLPLTAYARERSVLPSAYSSFDYFAPMPLYADQLGRKVELKQPPQRIISLVPSQTELLFSLGLDKEVVGITKFCVHPESWFRTKTRVGGTKQLHIDRIKQLQPDLIIANKEENGREQIEELAKEFPVWISDVNNVQGALEMVQAVGILTGRPREAGDLITQIKTVFTQAQPPETRLKTAYLIWKDPYMTIGGDTFINDMLDHAGFTNIFADRLRYPELSLNELRELDCELLLLSSEPYPFKQKHVEELQLHLPGTRIILVDGEIFSWYGSRLLRAREYFQKLRQQIRALSLF